MSEGASIPTAHAAPSHDRTDWFLRLVLRSLQIAVVVAVALGRYAVRRVRGEGRDQEARERLRGDLTAGVLETLGATFVKFGQILGSRPDLLAPTYIEALSRLQTMAAERDRFHAALSEIADIVRGLV